MTTDKALERATPESQGVDPAAVTALVKGGNERKLDLHSVMVVRHGKVVAEGWWNPYAPETPHMMYSVSKSLVALAVGMLVDEGRVSLDEEMLDVFPTLATDEARANAAGLKVRHLLAMASGHATDTTGPMRALPQHDWLALFFAVPIEYPPGTHFLYNSGCTVVLTAMVQARTGQSVLDFLTPRLFEPMGIKVPFWELSPTGLVLGFSGSNLRTEDLAKLGQLFINRGMWGGTRIVSEAWIDEMQSLHVKNGRDPEDDWGQGYCFQMWRSRHGGFRMDGAYGQFSLIMPERDLVVAITAGTNNNRAVPALVWDTLLPGIHDAALPEDTDARAAMTEALGSQQVYLPDYLAEDPAIAKQIAGRHIPLPFNVLGAESLTLAFTHDIIEMQVSRTAGVPAEKVVAGRDHWVSGQSTMWPHSGMDTVLTGSQAGWLDNKTLEIRQQCIETPFARVWKLEFHSEGTVTVSVGIDKGPWVARTDVMDCSVS